MLRDNTEIFDQRLDIRVHRYPDKPSPPFTSDLFKAQRLCGHTLRKVVRLGYLFDASIQMVFPAMKATAQVRRVATPRCLQLIAPVLANVVERTSDAVFCAGHKN